MLFTCMIQSLSMHKYLDYLDKLQTLHRDIDPATNDIVELLRDERPTIREEAIQDYQVSLPDFADVPRKVSDAKLIKRIASAMSEKYEKTIAHSDRDTYTNDNIFYVDNKPYLTPTAVKNFNKALHYQIDAYYNRTGQHIPDAFFALHPRNDSGKIHLHSTTEIIAFIRKTYISDAQISRTEAVIYRRIVCELLIRMMAYADREQYKDEIEKSVKNFDLYTRTRLTTGFFHMPINDNPQTIKDKSDVRYFLDKRFWLTRDGLASIGVNYPKDILFTLRVRPKSDESIEKKVLFDPKLNSAAANGDTGGIRFICQSLEDAYIIQYYVAYVNNKNNVAYNNILRNQFPQ